METVVGATETLNLNSNLSNIDAGFKENKIFDLKLDKYINKVKIKNSTGVQIASYDKEKLAKVEILDNGQIISEWDPRTGETINHLKVLPDGRVFIEADQEIIQSATLKVTYAISVNTKKAEIDYNSQDYYIYGTVPNNNEGWRIATITRLYDYLSNELAFDDTNADNTSTWTDIKISSDMVTEGYLSEDVYKELKKYNRIFQTNRWK